MAGPAPIGGWVAQLPPLGSVPQIEEVPPLSSARPRTRTQIEGERIVRLSRCITLPSIDLLQQKSPLPIRQNQLFQSRSILLRVAPKVHLKSTG